MFFECPSKGALPTSEPVPTRMEETEINVVALKSQKYGLDNSPTESSSLFKHILIKMHLFCHLHFLVKKDVPSFP